MNYRNESTCTIDNWFCNGIIPCNQCSTALDYLKNFWSVWAEEHGYDPNNLEFYENGESVDVFVRRG